MKKWFWRYRKLSKKLWFRSTLYCVMGIITAIVGIVFKGYIPDDLPRKVGADAVDAILNIIATSMLAVTTFSLTTMVSATAAASSSTTPRVTKLLVEDTIAQRALATFLGAFLFSLVGIIALKTGLYGDKGRLIMLAATLVVITFIVVTLLRWINHLSLLGRVGETIDRAENAVTNAMKDYARHPYYGGHQLGDIPSEATAIYAKTIGYVEHVNMSDLTSVCKAHGANIYIAMRPGSFAVPSEPIAFILSDDHATREPFTKEEVERIQKAFTIADSRSFEQDPRFGLTVLCEIAQRALSPAVNDPGTAIDVIGTLVRVLAVAAEASKYDPEKAKEELRHPRVYVPSLVVKDFIEDAFMPITRDAASMLEVSIRVQKACGALAVLNEDFRVASYDLSRLALRRSLEAMTFEPDHARLKAEAAVELSEEQSDV